MTRLTCLWGERLKNTVWGTRSCSRSVILSRRPETKHKRRDREQELFLASLKTLLNFAPTQASLGHHGDLTESPRCRVPGGDCSAFSYEPTFNELFVSGHMTRNLKLWSKAAEVFQRHVCVCSEFKRAVSCTKLQNRIRTTVKKTKKQLGSDLNEETHTYTPSEAWTSRSSCGADDRVVTHCEPRRKNNLPGVLRQREEKTPERWKHYHVCGSGTPVRQDSVHTVLMWRSLTDERFHHTLKRCIM